MRQNTFIVACLCSVAAIAVVSAVPLPASDRELDVLQIPLTNGKELDVLTVGAKDQEQLIADRNKRTIGLLRELFPDITKQIDSIVNRIIAQVIRVVGPSLLPALLGNRSQAPTTSSFDADFDDSDDEDDDDNDNGTSSSNDTRNVTDNEVNNNNKTNDEGTRVKIDLPTFAPETKDSTAATPAANKVSSTTPSTTSTSSTSSTSTSTSTTTTTTMPTTTTTSTSTTTTTNVPTTTRLPDEPKTTFDSILDLSKPTSKPIVQTDSSSTTTPPTNTSISFYPVTYTTTFDPTNINSVTNSPTATTDATTSRKLTDLLQNSDEAIDVDETQIVAIVDNLNRLLNNTNYFITTRDNLTSTTTTTSSSTSTTTTTMPTPIATTVKITKLLPSGATDTQIDLSAINKQLEETIRVARQVKEAEAAAQAQQLQQAPPQLPIPQSPAKPLPEQTIQLSFNNEVSPLTTNDNLKAVNNDLQSTESKSPAIDELTLDSNEDTADLDDRNKRFLSFGGAGLAGGSSGGSSGAGGSGGAPGAPGGSGNFLFDIVRLFSGSVQTQTGDEAANSANSVSGSDTDADSDANRAADGYTEGIPGPVTRLVVLANRGLANLIQDLILRIAATSEKFVNFKAKLITALI